MSEWRGLATECHILLQPAWQKVAESKWTTTGKIKISECNANTQNEFYDVNLKIFHSTSLFRSRVYLLYVSATKNSQKM